MAEVDWPSWPSATVPVAGPGLLVAERYLLREPLGVGAMGAVWLGTDQRLGRSVALKQVVLAPGLDGRQATAARLRIMREGRIAARLQHPHAVSIYDVAMQDGEPWLVMEYVEARSLAEVLTTDGLLADRAAARIGAQLADALVAAHKAEIVHRDVKPGNVLLCHHGTVKLADFGIARAVGDITVTQTGVLTGTPDYFAPEIARGEEPTSAADVFSLGATLYIAVEGTPPFGSERNSLTQLHVVASGETIPPIRAGRLGPALTQLLDPDPARRPTAAQARAMLADAAYGSGAPMPVPPPREPGRPDLAVRLPPPGPGPRHAHAVTRTRRRRLAIGGLTVVVVAALGGGVGVALSHDPSIEDSSAAAESVVGEAALRSAARDYFALLPDRPSEAWNRLTPKAQAQLGGADAYLEYWRTVSSVQVVDSTVEPGQRATETQLRLQVDDGQMRTVNQRLVHVTGPDGRPLIDSIGPG